MASQSATCTSQIHTYGCLRNKGHLFYMTSLESDKLLAIVQGTPAHVLHTLSASLTKEELLAEIFRIRDQEKAAQGNPSHKAATSLGTLMYTSKAGILEMAHENPNDLLELMEKAIPADTSLSPRTVSTANPSEATAIAIGWQLDALRQNYPLHTGQATPALENPPPPANSIAPAHHVSITTGPLAAIFAVTSNPVSNPGLDNGISDEDDEEPPKKRQKGLVVSQNYTIGLEEAENATLKHYPGKRMSSTSLFVDRLLAPSISNMLTAGGADIPTFLSSKFQHWRRSASGQP